MKILNEKNKVVGAVDYIKPFHYEFKGNNNITFPIHASSQAHACAKVCKFMGKGYFFLLFTI